MRRFEILVPEGLLVILDARALPPVAAAIVPAGDAAWNADRWFSSAQGARLAVDLAMELLFSFAFGEGIDRRVALLHVAEALAAGQLVAYLVQVTLSGAGAPVQAPPQQQPPAAKQPATLDGVVTDGSNPLAKASVTLKGRGAAVIADDQGRFDFGEVDPKEYTVEATFEGWKGSIKVTVVASTASHVTVPITTSIKVTRSPKKIIYAYNESITFTATATPPAPAGAVFHWLVDGVEDTSQKGATYTKGLQPAATVADRRKEYVVSARALRATDKIEHVRVAQNANVGTANVAQSNAGLDTYGYTDASPAQFDTTMTAAEDTALQAHFPVPRQIRAQTTAGVTTYGRLQFTAGAFSWDMETRAWDYRSAAIIAVKSTAYNWNKEELDGMLQHELQHCAHRTATTTATTVWKKLYDVGFAAGFTPFTEMFGYYQYVQSTTLSFKFMIDYSAIGSFVREYNNAKSALGGLSGTTKTDAQALIQGRYDGAQFSELREAAAEGWDHHIDKPP